MGSSPTSATKENSMQLLRVNGTLKGEWFDVIIGTGMHFPETMYISSMIIFATFESTWWGVLHSCSEQQVSILGVSFFGLWRVG